MYHFLLKELTTDQGFSFANDLFVGAQEIIQICGINGAGKTSLLNLLKLKNDSFSLLSQSREIQFYPRSLKAYLDIYKYCDSVNVDRLSFLIHQFNLHSKQHLSVDDLSAGEYQLLKISITLSISAPIYLLDEPFQNIHRDFIPLINDHFEILRSAGSSLIVIDHEELLSHSSLKKIQLTRSDSLITLESFNE